MNVLDKIISYYPATHETNNGVHINLMTLLTSDKHKEIIQKLRSSDAATQKIIKASLPCYTVAGKFNRRCQDGLIELSGLAAVDLDSAEDYDIPSLMHELKKIPSIAYAGLSCRGQRLFCIVPFKFPDKYEKQYERLIKSFVDMGLPMGDSCHKQISQPRYVSYNQAATQFFNYNAIPYDKLPVEKTVHVFKTYKSKSFTNQPTDKFTFAKNILEKQSCFFSDGNKHNYLYNLCCILNKMGITLSEAENYISTFFPISQITSNCIKHPYKHYANEFNTWVFETTNPSSYQIVKPTD